MAEPVDKSTENPTEHLPSGESPPAGNAAPPPPPTVSPTVPPTVPPPRSRWRGRNVPLLGVVAVALIACVLGAGITAVAAVAVAAFGHGDRGHPSIVDDRGNRAGHGPGINPYNGGPGRHRGQPVPGASPPTPAPSPSTS